MEYSAKEVIDASRKIYETALVVAVGQWLPNLPDDIQARMVDMVLKASIDRPGYLKALLVDVGLKPA